LIGFEALGSFALVPPPNKVPRLNGSFSLITNDDDRAGLYPTLLAESCAEVPHLEGTNEYASTTLGAANKSRALMVESFMLIFSA
jgi:hypothetical protein